METNPLGLSQSLEPFEALEAETGGPRGSEENEKPVRKMPLLPLKAEGPSHGNAGSFYLRAALA